MVFHTANSGDNRRQIEGIQSNEPNLDENWERQTSDKKEECHDSRDREARLPDQSHSREDWNYNQKQIRGDRSKFEKEEKRNDQEQPIDDRRDSTSRGRDYTPRSEYPRHRDNPRYSDRNWPHSDERKGKDDSRYERKTDDVRHERRQEDSRYDTSRFSDRSKYSNFRNSRRPRSIGRSPDRNYSNSDGDDSSWNRQSRFKEDRDDDRRYSKSRDHGDDRRYHSSSHSGSSRYRDRDSDYSSESSSRRRDRYRSPDYDGDRYDRDGRRRSWREREDRNNSQEDSYGSGIPDTEEKCTVKNMFQNDGSFLEMFKKMQEAQKPPETSENDKTAEMSGSFSPEQEGGSTLLPICGLRRAAASIVGKRRGGKVLPTGMVKKQKKEEEVQESPKDAWSVYMAEVRKYKQVSCEEEGKTRSLVK